MDTTANAVTVGLAGETDSLLTACKAVHEAGRVKPQIASPNIGCPADSVQQADSRSPLVVRPWQMEADCFVEQRLWTDCSSTLIARVLRNPPLPPGINMTAKYLAPTLRVDKEMI